MPLSTPTLAAEAVLFAIHSAIKLSRNIQRAYAQSLQGRILVLPLPDFDTNIDLSTMIAFFEWSPELLEGFDDLRKLHGRAMQDLQLPAEELQRYRQYYLGFKQVAEGKVLELQAPDLWNLFRVRQWQEGYLERDSALKLVMGSLVEVGIDYFLDVPGALNQHSSRGRILRHFLSAFDEVQFAEGAPLYEQFNAIMLPRLFAAAAETVGELTPEVSEDEKVQLFIRTTTRHIAEDLYERSVQLSFQEQETIINWGQLLLRSSIRHAGEFVAANPELLFDTNYPTSRIIERSTGVLLRAILDSPGDQVSLRETLSVQTLDELVQVTLEVVARHPRLITGAQRLEDLITQTAKALQSADLQQPEVLPDILRIILQQSAGQLMVLWPTTAGTAEHLLVNALRQILTVVANNAEAQGWNTVLTKEDWRDLLEFLLAEVVANPGWIEEEVRGRPVLAEVVDVVFRALRHLPEGERLSPEVLHFMIRISLRTALTSEAVLDTLPWSTDERETIILEQALQLVFIVIYDKKTPKLSRLELLEELLEYVLETIIAEHPNRAGLVLTELVLFESGMVYEQGFDAELADDLIDAALLAFANYPELVTQNEGMQYLVRSLARAVDSASLRQAGLLPFLLRLVLEKTGEHAHVLIDAETGTPRHLLVIATREILAALTQREDREGRWRPGLSPEQGIYLLELLLEEVVRYPDWVTGRVGQQTVLRTVLDTVFDVLETIPTGSRLSAGTLELIVQSSLYAAVRSPKVLAKVTFATNTLERSILEHALRMVFSFVFPTGVNSTPTYRLHLLEELLAYILDGLLLRYPNERGLILIDLVLFGQNGLDFSEGFDEAQADQLIESALMALDQYPELVARDRVLQLLVSDVAGALRDSGLGKPELLPELLRLTIERTAHNLHLVLDIDEEEPVSILVVALEQTLKTIAAPPRSGKWKPRLSQEQILDILEVVYEAVLEHPQWVGPEPLIYEVLEAFFRALESVPVRQPLPYLLLRMLLQSLLEAARSDWRFLIRVQATEFGHYHILMRFALEDLFILLYDPENNKATRWHLSQRPVIEALTGYFLLLVSEEGGNLEAVARAKARVQEVVALWKQDFRRTFEEVLEVLGA
ncbi:MAG: hypothetical protein RIC19_16990 [Phaeodactylibacter sp.]|uniref:hypothetical protein n=1 Tax=Phaeodactylibacter sp. TaxID=1940289 RepID=UPI0032EC820B